MFDLDFQGQLWRSGDTYISHIEIPNIGYVQIDSKICVFVTYTTLIFKVILWGQVTNFNNCEIRGIEHNEIDT